MTTVKTVRKILKYLHGTSDENITLRSISLDTKIHFYAIRDAMEFLKDLGIVSTIPYANTEKYVIVGVAQ